MTGPLAPLGITPSREVVKVLAEVHPASRGRWPGRATGTDDGPGRSPFIQPGACRGGRTHFAAMTRRWPGVSARPGNGLNPCGIASPLAAIIYSFGLHIGAFRPCSLTTLPGQDGSGIGGCSASDPRCRRCCQAATISVRTNAERKRHVDLVDSVCCHLDRDCVLARPCRWPEGPQLHRVLYL